MDFSGFLGFLGVASLFVGFLIIAGYWAFSKGEESESWVVAFLFGWFCIMTGGVLIWAGHQTQVVSTQETVEEHKVVASALDSEITGDVFAMNTGQVLRWARAEPSDNNLTRVTIIEADVDEIELYQGDHEPVERRHYKVQVTRGGHETKELEKVELIVPTGSVVEVHKIDVNQ